MYTVFSAPHPRRLGHFRAAVILLISVALALGVDAAIGGSGASATTPNHYFATSSVWLDPTSAADPLAPGSHPQAAFVQGWDATHGVAVNEIGSNGISEGFAASAAGTISSASACVTCNIADATWDGYSAPETSGQRGISDVFPDGNHVVITMEHGHSGTIGGSSSEPGKGVYNDLWIANWDGSNAYRVWTTCPVADPADSSNPNPCLHEDDHPFLDPPANHGLIWARLNSAGTQLAWAEMYKGVAAPSNQQLGSWRLRIANVTWTSGVPSLTGVQTFQWSDDTGNFYEPYGFSPDGSKLLFASSYGTAGVGDTQIWQLPIGAGGSISGDPVQLSVPYRPGTWWDYNEFAFYTPDGSHIIFGRTRDSHINGIRVAGGLDYWIVDADGTHLDRLTYYNEPWSPEFAGYTNVGGWAFDPNNPNHLLVGRCNVTACTTGDIASITLTSDASGSGTGLTGKYYDGTDPNTGTLVTTQVNKQVDFEFGTTAPATGVPTTNYSIRWTGHVTAPVSGSYTLCTYTDDGSRLTWAGTQIINDWVNHAARLDCAAPRNLTAGTSYSIKMDMYNASGGGTAKLIWSVPGYGTEIIPNGRLSPT